MKENVCVSACLLGYQCRWHGKVCESLAAKLILSRFGDVNVIPVCPEMWGGLPCPRPPVKRVGGRVFQTCPDKKRRREVTGEEVTEQFRNGANIVLRVCRDYQVRRVVFCQYSPSCDKTGICGRLLTENGIEVFNTF